MTRSSEASPQTVRQSSGLPVSGVSDPAGET